MISHAVSAIDVYSASAVDSAIVRCLFEFQVIAPPFRIIKTFPFVEDMSSFDAKLPTQPGHGARKLTIRLMVGNGWRGRNKDGRPSTLRPGYIF